MSDAAGSGRAALGAALPVFAYVIEAETGAVIESAGRIAALAEGAAESWPPALWPPPGLCAPEDLPRLTAHRAMVAGLPAGETRQIVYRLRSPGGGWLWLLSTEATYDPRARRIAGAAVDVSRQKALERRAAADLTAAEAANEDLRAFAYAVSHQMRSPTITLELLLSEIELGHAHQLDSEGRSLLRLALGTLKDTGTLFADILDYARILGRPPLHDPVDLDRLVPEAVAGLVAGGAGATEAVSLGPLPVVAGDARALGLLFGHLIGNALTYRHPERPPRIEVRAWPDAPPGWVDVAVADNGIGIAPAAQERIFALFERLHLSDEIAGSGLGLAICRRVAAQHGGTIRVVSEEGEGATFVVRLRLWEGRDG